MGNRRWEKHWLSSRATAPEPFVRMDLRYENSFGGKGFPANPIGKGFADLPDGKGGEFRPMPNLEDPASPILSQGNRPAPAGFGPLDPKWAIRRNKLGTYKGAYRKTRWPWFPEDLDWTHFNAAPPDMQLDGFLRGDEPLVFENLHPRHARYESKLPGLRLRCFLETSPAQQPGEVNFTEVPLQLDTLWVDLEAEKLVLVWRGWAPVSSEDFEEVQQLCVLSEPLEKPPASVEQCRRQFLASVAAEKAAAAPEAPAPVEAAAPVQKEEPSPAEIEADQKARAAAKAALAAKLQQQTDAICAQLGFDLKALPPALRLEHQAKQTSLIEQLVENDPAGARMAQHKVLQADLQGTLSKLGVDANNLPPLSAKAQAEQIRMMQELGIQDTTSPAARELAETWRTIAAILPHVGLNPEDLTPFIEQAKLQQKKLGLPAKPVVPGGKEPPPLTRESVKARIAEGGSFEGADLRGLDFAGDDLTGADFAGANLTGASLRKTCLKQANLSKAILIDADLTAIDLTNANAAEADFTGAKLPQAVLKSADLTKAKLGKADLTKAVLDGAILEETDLRGARLIESSAIRTVFLRADLTGANCQKANCRQADFSKATLSQADFQGTDLTEAGVNGVIARKLNLTGATLTKLRAGGGGDFTDAKMTGAQGNGSMWKGANLTGADFRHAQMEEALFTSACLKQANLSAANLKLARFNKANLREAKLLQVNLFQGNLEKADLTQTDFSGSNMYEVEFHDAVLHRTTADGANLKMTKLDPL